MGPAFEREQPKMPQMWRGTMFAVGDMIPLEVSSRPEISLWIDGFKDSEPLMTGQLGRWRGQKGVRISKPAPLGFADPMITLMEELE